MSRKEENVGFVCGYCGRTVAPVSNGSFRNHCPFCLFSKHVDGLPGDRMNACLGLMEPIDLRQKSGKGFQVVHRCLRCGFERANRVAENTIQPDNMERLIELF